MEDPGRRYRLRLCPPVLQTASRIVNVAWSTAVGSDFVHTETTGPKPPGTDLVNRHMDRVLVAAQATTPCRYGSTSGGHGSPPRVAACSAFRDASPPCRPSLRPRRPSRLNNNTHLGSPPVSLKPIDTGRVERADRLIGRDGQVARLREATASARAGSGGIALVIGPAGIGKSALVRHSVDQDPHAISGRASPPPSPTAQPLVELALAMLRRGADPFAGALAVHRGALNVVLPGSGLAAGDMERPTPMHLVDALLDLRDTIVRRRPDLFLLEDLHWADDVTLRAVEYLVDRVHGTTTFVVATTRPTDQTVHLSERLAARRAGVVLRLDGLTPLDVAGVAEECLGEPPPEGLLDALGVADGNPLQIEELLFAYERSGALSATKAGWQFEPEPGEVPVSVAESTSGRLAGVRPADRAVVEAAALLGRSFDATVLATALDLTPSAVDDALRASLVAGLLTPEPGAARPWFAHELIRAAVASQIGANQRRDLANRLYRVLATHDDDGTLELAAELAALAGEGEAAATALARSGRSHLERGLPAQAVARFDAALSYLTRQADALPLREALLNALALTGDVGRARAEAQLVRRQLDAVGADRERVDACAIAAARAAANAAAWGDADVLLADLLRRPDPPAAAAALGALVALERGEFKRAELRARHVVDGSEATPEHRCEAFEVLGRLARREDLVAAADWFTRAVATAELSDLHLWAARASHELATVDQLRTLEVVPLHEARTRAVRAGAPGLTAAVDFHLAAVHGVRFEPKSALEAGRRFLDVARRLGATRQEAWAWNLIGQAHAAAGDRARANAAAAEALALAADDDEIAAVAVGTARGLASLLAEDRDRGIAELTEGVARLRRLPSRGPLPPWYLWPILATVYDLEGDGGARARQETDDPALRVACAVDGLCHLASAVASGRGGDRSAAEANVDAADRCFAQVPSFKGYMHLARRFAAEAAIVDGWGDPASWLRAGELWAHDAGHAGLRAACVALGRRAGIRPSRRRRGAADVPPRLASLGVRSREVDVLLLVAEGRTNAEVAERLYLSPRTVKGYVESLLSKTGAANRTQLAAFAEVATNQADNRT